MTQNIFLREEQKLPWFIFASSYLDLAKLACLEMTEHKHGFEIKGLYIATIYNIKHAIEIILKELRISLKNSYSEGHDSRKLLEDLERCISFEDIKKRQQKQLLKYQQNPATDEKERKFEEDSKELLSGDPKKLFHALKKLVLKYHHLEFLKEKIGTNYLISDPENDAFRYPANRLTIELRYHELLEAITPFDIDQITKDVKKLSSTYIGFAVLIMITESGT